MSFEFSNHLLRQLPAADLALIVPHLTRIELESNSIFYEAGQPIPHVNFIENGLVSFLAEMQDGSSIEVASVGWEGAVGLAPHMEPRRSLYGAVVRLPLTVQRIDFDLFRQAAAGSEPIRDMAERYQATVFAQVAQLVACNALHSTEARLARWISLARDRLVSDEIPVTQEFLADTLGVKRTTVTETAGKLHNRGLISHRWGTLTIRDRNALREAACECYGVIQQRFARLEPKPARRADANGTTMHHKGCDPAGRE